MDHLQAVLKELDTTTTSNKDFVIWYFRDGLSPSLCMQINKWDQDLENWQEVIKKTIDAKAKAD